MSGVTFTHEGGVLYEYDYVSRYPKLTRDEQRRNRVGTKKLRGWHLRWTQEALVKLYPERYVRKLTMSSTYGKVAGKTATPVRYDGLQLREFFGVGSAVQALRDSARTDRR